MSISGLIIIIPVNINTKAFPTSAAARTAAPATARTAAPTTAPTAAPTTAFPAFAPAAAPATAPPAAAAVAPNFSITNAAAAISPIMITIPHTASGTVNNIYSKYINL